ncbi:MAG: sugar phosphate isomerase/epimerase [Actinobacteria bacterium]|nr:sugar phosphate isomerase/epimerase [Actinomycetota bacterium]
MTSSAATGPLLQCSTGPFWTFELERALDTIAEAGFSAVELMITRDPATQDPVAALELATARGLQISSVHGPFLVITRTVWGLEATHKVTRGIEVCEALGAGTYVVHPPYLWERRYAQWLAEHAAGPASNVKVAVETMYPKWVGRRRARGYRWLEPAQLVERSPWVVMDTSHLAVSRIDLEPAYHTLAPKLAHIHLSDNALDGRDGHLSVGDGGLPIDDLVDELVRTKYAGTIALELSVARYLERPKELASMLKRNRERVEERLARDPTRAGNTQSRTILGG